MSKLGTCFSCVHWIPQVENGAPIIGMGPIPGECHCRPPYVQYLATPQGLVIQTQFPLPTSIMWCGEYRPDVVKDKEGDAA